MNLIERAEASAAEIGELWVEELHGGAAHNAHDAIDRAEAVIGKLLEIVKRLPVTADGVVITLGMVVYYRCPGLKDGAIIGYMTVGTIRRDGAFNACGGRDHYLGGDNPEPMWSTRQLAREYHAKVKADEAREAAEAARRGE